MTTKEIIILAGGKGTRLATVNSTLPKCLLAIRERPFLHYVIRYYISQGINHFIFCLGHLHQHIRQDLDMHFPGLVRTIVVENEPLDTGGAIRQALTLAIGSQVFVANGDTYFEADLGRLEAFHLEHDADCSIALTHLADTERYGRVTRDANDRITGFEEKGRKGDGVINGGIYLINRDRFSGRLMPRVFSFEKDYLQQDIAKGNIYGLQQDAYFVDIGIPADLLRAQKEMPAYDK